mmetsp:Transcript_15928/g.43702  ORF Transcript_15928/g.43702 Transcript_15928/m.43702 type:complete len:247 (+) Transcript_15928:1018-1758(+)
MPRRKAEALLAATAALPEPTHPHAILDTPRPEETRLDLVADDGAPFQRIATELVRLLALVVPAALLCPIRREINHQRLSLVPAMDDKIPPQAVRPSVLHRRRGRRWAPLKALKTPNVVVVAGAPRRRAAKVQRQRLQAVAGDARALRSNVPIHRLKRLECEVELEGRGDASLATRRGQLAADLRKFRNEVVGAIIAQMYYLRRLVGGRRIAIVLALRNVFYTWQRPTLQPVGVENVRACVATLARG